MPLFIVIASATTFAVHFNWVSYGAQGLSFNIMHAHADDGGDGGGSDSGGDAGDGGSGSDSGGDAGDGGSGSDSGGDAGGGGSDSGGDAGDTGGGDTGGDDTDGGGDTTPPPAPPVAPTCAFWASPTSIVPGGSVTLSWTTANATSVVLDHNIGPSDWNSSITFAPWPWVSTTYVLTATGAGGSVTCSTSVTVSVLPPPPPPPSAPVCSTSITASPAKTEPYGDVPVRWSSTNAVSCTIEKVSPDGTTGDWCAQFGGCSTNGSKTVTPYKLGTHQY
ncbi:MAG: hypothetical protein Q7S95_00540, partial [bacterium]|nr:hypothetical protein [bacterium]